MVPMMKSTLYFPKQPRLMLLPISQVSHSLKPLLVLFLNKNLFNSIALVDLQAFFKIHLRISQILQQMTPLMSRLQQRRHQLPLTIKLSKLKLQQRQLNQLLTQLPNKQLLQRLPHKQNLKLHQLPKKKQKLLQPLKKPQHQPPKPNPQLKLVKQQLRLIQLAWMKYRQPESEWPNYRHKWTQISKLLKIEEPNKQRLSQCKEMILRVNSKA